MPLGPLPFGFKTSRFGVILVALLAILSVGTAAEPAAWPLLSRGLFVDVPAPGLAVEHRPTVSRHRVVTVDVAGLRAQRNIGAKLRLNIFTDADFDAVIDSVIERGADDFSLMGSFPGQPHSAFGIAVKDGVAVMNVRLATKMYHLRYVGNSFYEVRQIDESKFPPCGNTEKQAVGSPGTELEFAL